jgi:hypothetical protein
MDAFADLAPVSDEYARLPVGKAFTWGPVATALEAGEWYMVAFRSILRADADTERLTRYDTWAHEDAARAEGFVHYFKGPLAADRACLSFCLWNSRAEARAAAARPAHRDAVELIADTYEAYTLEFLRVRKQAGSAKLEFEAYDFAADAAAAAATNTLPANLGFSPAPS